MRSASDDGPVRLAVVDDDPMVRAALGMMLGGDSGLVVVAEAGDGEEALRVVPASDADVVLMDIRMPRMDGIAARRQMAADPALASIPVVALSADVLTWPETRVLQEGFAAHLPKPCNLNRISALVAGLARREAPSGLAAGMGPALAV